MPFYLRELEVMPELAGVDSVLIVPCRFCPAVSLALRENKPYLEPLRRLMRTKAYESFIRALKQRLEDRGIKTSVFNSLLPHHYVACLWTVGRRRQLARRAAKFDAVLVLGCDATTETVRNAIGPTGPRVIQAMEIEGIVNLVPTVHFPFTVSLTRQGMTPVAVVEPSAKKIVSQVNGQP